MSIFYSVPDVPKCVLASDSDLKSLLSLSRSFGIERIRLDIYINECVQAIATNSQYESNFIGNIFEDNLLTHNFSSGNKTLRTVRWDKLLNNVGQMFQGGAKEFRLALLKSSIELGFKFKYLKNDLRRITVVCIEKDTLQCKWYVHATIEKCNGFFYIRRMNNIHTCGSSFSSLRNKRISSELISSIIVDKVREDPGARAVEMVRHISNEYGLIVPYHNVWVGLEKAKKVVIGDEDESFEQLRAYVDAATKSNPGSHFILDVDESSGRFRRLFVSFKACSGGFIYCRPLLFVDGTHLKGKYKGHLLAAVSKDGDQGLFPVAFCIVDSENEENWTWFFGLLRDILGVKRNITFVSDRNPGLVSSLRTIFPDAFHGYCLNHLKMNLRDKFGGRRFSKYIRNRMIWLFMSCAYSLSRESFEVNMSMLLREGGKDAYDFFKNLDPANWSNAYFQGQRYGEMYSNAVESFNNWILEERELPIVKLIDAIRVKIMKQFYDRRLKAESWNFALCPNIEKKLVQLYTEARTLTVVGSWETTYEVNCNPVVQVCLAGRTCSCRLWDTNGLPCVHAVACIFKDGRQPVSSYVEQYFHVSNYKKSYAGVIYPVLLSNNHEIVLSESQTVLAPVTKRPPGRPKKKRFLSRGEYEVRMMKCGRCGKTARHNKKTCTEPIC